MASSAQEIRRSTRGKRSRQAELFRRAGRTARRKIRNCSSRRWQDCFFGGNGGSATDALHLAAELVVRLCTERKGLAAFALTTNPSVLTGQAMTAGSSTFFHARSSRWLPRRTFSSHFPRVVTAPISCGALKLAALAAPTLWPLRVKRGAHSPASWTCS